MVETFETAQASGNQNYPNLLAFSLGEQDAQATYDNFGPQSFEDLFLLMAQARLPMPRLAETATDDMVKSLHRLPTE